MKIRSISLVTLVAVALFAPMALAKPPSWDAVIAGKGRFKVLKKFNDVAVIDNETGLVWQRDPSGNNFNSWAGALSFCRGLDAGTRGGWRLPSIEELRSLADLTQNAPALAAGHPFQNVFADINDFYWTSTRDSGDATLAFSMRFFNGGVVLNTKASSQRVWCTRGGQGQEGL
jgi:hypothetical protein